MGWSRRVVGFGCAAGMFLVVASALLSGADEPIDWNKAQQIHRKATQGQPLTDEEKAYYERAKAARAKGQNTPRPDGGQRPAGGKPSVGFVPLTDMTADQRYKGEAGGLYGHGSNTPPEPHLKAAMAAAAKVQPLDPSGKPAAPSAGGRIVMITQGMSNTTQASQAFIRQATADARKNPALVLVDGAFGGMTSTRWVSNEGRDGRGPWDMLADRLKSAGVTDQQVQVVWMKHAIANPASLGEFPKHAQQLKDDQAKIVTMLKAKFPNLRLVYASSRTYAGWATTQLNPEPFAYESAFATRWLIQEQAEAKNPALTYGKAPVILWGPYLWTDGEKGRKLDDLTWQRDDTANDGTHPSRSGQEKGGAQLLKFFTTDPTAKAWFTRS